jgi:signal transduction histidine kinase
LLILVVLRPSSFNFVVIEKYTHEGSTIFLSVKKEKDTVVFAVEDQGLGIAPEYIGRVFERYYQVPGTLAKGNGLGLAISKDFIEAQKGRVWASSIIGKGSMFHFSLPQVNR